ncbi:MAG: DNA primase catalytic subunit PriS [Methanomicrobiaceae archaeon]|nr:DNA primase catalytic subunit PriS [Methanomicrobiaceae archaeon]
MNHATAEYLKQIFSSYYTEGTIIMPPALAQREWGFLFFDPGNEGWMRRHVAFATKREALEYLRTMAPRHVFYSTAYYSLPSAGSMHEKGWCGADLIFDLDADHIVRGPYAVMLERVREETVKLVGMLTEELGFPKREIEVVFSGGRGYHVHVRSLGVRGWSSQERREIVDYVCGTGIDPRRMREGAGGWHGRFRSALAGELTRIAGMERKEAIGVLADLEGVGKGTAAIFFQNIGEHIARISDPGQPLPLSDRVISALTSEENGPFAALLKETAALTDEPVTTDTKRLIRLPTSLHGGSGMRVTRLSIAELERFDPLVDAVVFDEREVWIDLPQPIPYPVPMLGNDYLLEKGRATVPEALAVFLCCRGLAEYAGRVG